MNYENFSLVLSGGGALGIAHLGVLEDLEFQDIVPKEIIGTSMGGIIGACLAIGLREKEIYNLFERFANIFNWVKFSFSGNSIIKSSKIEAIFSDIFGNLKMKETKIPLKLIATNLSNAEKKVFDKSDDVFIKDALLSTMAIPGVFEEKIIDGVTYVDGFLCDNLGINEASCNEVLAVDVVGINSFKSSLPKHFLKTKNVIDMFERSMRLLIYNQTKSNIKDVHKNIQIIEPDTKDFKTFYFHKYKEIKALGKGLL